MKKNIDAKLYGIPTCADKKYKSWYFGLRPYFQTRFNISEADLEEYKKSVFNERNHWSKELLVNLKKYFMAEILAYDYFSGLIDNDEQLFTIPMDKIKLIEEAIEENFKNK